MAARMKRVDHIGIAVADLAATEALLVGKLGLEKVREFKMPNGNAGAFYKVGDCELEVTFHGTPELRALRLEGAQARLEHLALEVDDIDGLAPVLAAMGITGQRTTAVTGDSIRSDKTTTAGITLQFIERKDR